MNHRTTFPEMEKLALTAMAQWRVWPGIWNVLSYIIGDFLCSF